MNVNWDIKMINQVCYLTQGSTYMTVRVSNYGYSDFDWSHDCPFYAHGTNNLTLTVCYDGLREMAAM